MNQSNNILNELKELSPALAAIPKRNVFSVPDGYFDQLSTFLVLQSRPADESAAVPEGYFDNLAGNILARIKQHAADNSHHSEVLSGIGNKNVFNVPANYFENLAENIVSKIYRESSSILAGIGNKNVFTVPEDYFENLSYRIISNVRDERVVSETTAISELVAGIGNKNVFTVPAGYFENLTADIKSTINVPAKVVKMGVRKTILKYAAAAVVTGLITTGALFIYNKNSDKTDTGTAALMAEAKKINNANSFDKELNAISDEAIVNYLEAKGQDVDAALVASLTDDTNTLPDAADYIIDETTLDNMLKELDLNN